MARKIVYSIALAIAVYFVKSVTGARSNESGGCEIYKHKQTAYFEWPFLLSCEELTYECEALYDYNGTAHCSMMFTESNETLFNVSYNPWDFDMNPTDDLNHQLQVKNETPTEVEVKISAPVLDAERVSCCSQVLTLEPTDLPNKTCEDALNSTEDVIQRSATQGDLILFPCETIEGSQPHLNIDDYQVNWYFNCQRELPSAVVEESDSTLMISSADYAKHPGTYSCSVTQNGVERFIISHRLCIKPSSLSPFPFLHCPQDSTYDKGDTAIITCQANIGSGEIYFMHSMFVSPIHGGGRLDRSRRNISCVSFLGQDKQKGEKESRVSCFFSEISQEPGPKCFDHAPTYEKWKVEKRKNFFRKLEVSYEIKNIQVEDFGWFKITIENTLARVEAMDVTMIARAPPLENTSVVIGWVIGAIVLLAVIVVFAFWSRQKMRYWWKES